MIPVTQVLHLMNGALQITKRFVLKSNRTVY